MYSNLYYHLSTAKLTYIEAEARCKAAQSILAFANSSQELQVIQGILPRDTQAWIGVKKTTSVNPPSLIWTADNSAFQFGIQANIKGLGTQCAVLTFGSSGSYSFEDAGCDVDHLFICQRDCPFNPYQKCE